TFGKADGHGLGLYGAQQVLKAWGGELRIASVPGEGTTVTVRLPRAETPCWFVPRLELRPGAAVVVLDDELSMHQLWAERFHRLGSVLQKLELRFFSSASELL